MRSTKKLESRINKFLNEGDNSLDKFLLNEVYRNFMQKIEILESLDASQYPMNDVVHQLYHQIENELNEFEQILQINPNGVKRILEVENQEYQKYKILKNVVESLLKTEANSYFSKFNLDPLHSAHNWISSFYSARKVINENEIDIGVVIGPEGFTYAGIFSLFDLPLRNIHIDEYCVTEDRPYKELDDLKIIQGKNILFIEDDVRTGKTLNKAYKNILRYSPLSISVYLGIPERNQNLCNIPPGFKKIYTTPDILSDEQIRDEIDEALEILKKRYSIFR